MESLTDDIICDIAMFCKPHDLVQLGRTCQRLGGKPGGFVAKSKRKRKSIFYSTKKRQRATSGIGKDAAKQQKADAERAKTERAKAVEMEGREWSLINEAARKIVEKAKSSDKEWNDSHLSERMTGNESWISVYRRLERQWKRPSLKFSRFIGNGAGYVKGDISHVRAKTGRCAELSLAFCHEVMKTGRHYAKFTIISPRKNDVWMGLPVGLLRPIHDDISPLTKTKVTMFDSRELLARIPLPLGYKKYCHDNSEEPGFKGEEHSFFVPLFPDRRPRHGITGLFPEYEPEGMVIGLLLDLDEGTLTGYCRGQRPRVLRRGLSGHYRWAAFPSAYCPSVKIQRAPFIFVNN